MAVNLYTYNDPGAPAHPNNTAGTMANLLRKCLVTGYTSGETTTNPAGWDEPYTEGNNFATFQSVVGLGQQIYQIDENQPDADVAVMKAGESVAAVDAALNGEWGSTYFGKQYSGSYARWYVVADEKTCYVLLESFYGFVLHGFGELNSLIPDDPYCSFLSGHKTSTSLPAADVTVGLHYAAGIGATSYGVYHHRSALGTFGSNGCINTFGSAGGTIGATSVVDDVSAVNSGLGWLHLPIPTSCVATNENTNNLVRGVLRGLSAPIASRPLADAEVYTDVTTGRDYICFHIGSGGSTAHHGCVLIDLTGPW